METHGYHLFQDKTYMAKFAYTENGNVKQVHDSLPTNWGRYSNFYLLENDIQFLNSIGWYKVKTVTPSYDYDKQKLGAFKYTFEDNVIIQTNEVINLEPEPQPEVVVEKTEEELEQERILEQLALKKENEERLEREWNVVRTQRDQLMAEGDWKYQRYQRETRLGIETTDNLTYIDEYMQALANITTQENPYMIVWPELKSKDSE
jgi:hypothetical protein